MTEDFDNFLTQYLNQEGKIFSPESDPLELPEVEAAEQNLGVKLPDSYKYFLLRCGSGLWCDESVASPDQLYAFDSDCSEMESFIALINNVRGIGDYIAFNPEDAETKGEKPLYYCSHEALTCVKVSDSFEDWTRKMVEARTQNIDLYDQIS